MPAIFALLGLAGVATARFLAIKFYPFLLTLSVLLLARAHYLVYVKRHGHRLSVLVVWVSTALVIAVWLPRIL